MENIHSGVGMQKVTGIKSVVLVLCFNRRLAYQRCTTPPLFFHQVSLMLLGREEHTMPTDWSRVKGSGEGLGELRPLFLESIVRTMYLYIYCISNKSQSPNWCYQVAFDDCSPHKCDRLQLVAALQANICDIEAAMKIINVWLLSTFLNDSFHLKVFIHPRKM